MSSDEPPRTFTYIKHSSISFDIHMENQHYECTVYRCLYLVCYTKKLFFFLTLRTTMRHDNISFPLNNSVFLKLTQQSNLQSVWLWFGVLFCLQSFFYIFYFNSIRLPRLYGFATTVQILLHQSKVDLRVNSKRVVITY